MHTTPIFTADDLDRVDISSRDIDRALDRPDSFMYHGSNKEMFETWSWGPCVLHRDSGLLDQSNYHALVRELELAEKNGIIEKDSYSISRASNWAVGWSEHLSFRAVDSERNPTRVFRWIQCWNDLLSEYPVVDESDYSEREYNATLANIEYAVNYAWLKSLPNDWASKVFDWLWENDQDQVTNSDDNGGYPSKDAVEEAIRALNLLGDE